MQVGDRVRIRYSGECPMCDRRDPQHVLEGVLGTIVHDMRDPDRSPWGSLFGHVWEVAPDSGPLHVDDVPGFGGQLDLPEPNFAEAELEPLW